METNEQVNIERQKVVNASNALEQAIDALIGIDTVGVDDIKGELMHQYGKLNKYLIEICR